MPGVLQGSLLDLLKGEIENYKKDTFAETQRYNAYGVSKFLFEEGREEADGGTDWVTQIRLRDSQSAAWTTFYTGLPVNVKNVMGQCSSSWAHLLDRSQAYDTREKMVNSGPAKIFDVIKGRMSAQREACWNLVEDACVLAPSVKTPTSDDPPQIKGLEYWFAPCLTAANVPYTDPIGGFNGQLIRYQNGETDTTIGGVDRSNAANTRARNWNFTYSGQGDQAFIDQIVRTMLQTGFESLPGLKGDTKSFQGRRLILAPTVIVADFIKVLNRRGTDDSDGDVNPFMDVKVAGQAVKKSGALDARPHLPVYGVTNKEVYGVVLKGRFLSPMDPVQQEGAPHVFDVPMEASCLTHMENPRHAGWVAHVPFAA